MEVAPYVGEAGQELEPAFHGLVVAIAGVCAQGVALDDTCARFANALDERANAAPDAPVVEEASTGYVDDPQVALRGFACAGIKIADGFLVDLRVVRGEGFPPDGSGDGFDYYDLC